MTLPKKTLIAFATRWGAQFGGINSFNQDLLSAFAAASYQQVLTVCVVLDANDEDKSNALSAQVRLVSLRCPGQKDFLPTLAAASLQALQEEGIQLDETETTWLGHDRITGGIALAAKKIHGGRAALINHMSYSHYEAFAENSAAANGKETEQKGLFRQADIVMAVGPLLRDALADMLNQQSVPMLVPGLPDIDVQQAPKRFKGFISGRLSEDAKKIKQAHLGVAAFADAIRQASENEGLPDALQNKHAPALTLRGVNFESSQGEYDAEAERELNLFAEKYAGDRIFRLHALPFTTNREVLFDDLRGSSVSMMPSWHEGFGLVAWEAIAAGVPLIISNKSGAYQMLEELNHGLYTSYVTPIDVAGSNKEPFFQEGDVSNLAMALISIAKNSTAARQKAACLREALCSKYSWASCARETLGILGWQLNESEPMAAVSSSVSAPLQPVASPNLINLLELPSPTWQPNIGLSDSQLLRAEEAIVPFDPKREPFLKTQIDWAESSDYPISIRLLIGAGGVGKTRLALELCRRLQEQGWHAGFLLSDCEAGQTPKLATQIRDAELPCCIVIDYAETRQSVLLALFESLLTSPLKHPVRLLLLARDGGDWWETLPDKKASCEALLQGLASSGPFTLPHLHDSESERQEAYLVALSALATRLQIIAPEHSPRLDEAHFARPLYIQMAALMALRGERPKSAESLPRAMLSHERRYWGRVLSGLDGNRSEHEEQSALLMALATLANGIATDRMLEQVWISIGEDKAQLKRLFKLLAPLYPDRQGLQGLRPDLIGEALVAQIILSPAGSKLLDAILGESNSTYRQSCLTVLARLLRYRDDLRTHVEDALVKNFILCAVDLIKISIETPSPLPQLIENAYQRLPSRIKEQATGLLMPLLRFEIIPLAVLDILVHQNFANKRHEQYQKKKNDITAGKYATALINLSKALEAHGNIEDALEKSEQASNIFSNLVKTKPGAYEESFADALKTYAIQMDNMGKHEKALIAAEQSLKISLKLAKVEPALHEHSLANAYNTYSNRLVQQGRTEESLAAINSALEIFKRLTLTDHENSEPDYAIALGNYSNRLFELDMPEQGMEALLQSLTIIRKLAAAAPERFEAKLSNILENHAIGLSKMGRFEEAQNEIEQALGINQKLAQAKPLRFELNLAETLNTYSSILAILGNTEGALSAKIQSLDIYQKKAKEKPELYLGLQETTRLTLVIWKWLFSNEATPVEIKLSQADIKDIRLKYLLEFLQLWLFAFLEQEPTILLQALKSWTNLDRSLQMYAQDHYLLLAALVEFQLGPDAAPKQWRELLERYRAQRKGRIPYWAAEVAKRAGFEL